VIAQFRRVVPFIERPKNLTSRTRLRAARQRDTPSHTTDSGTPRGPVRRFFSVLITPAVECSFAFANRALLRATSASDQSSMRISVTVSREQQNGNQTSLPCPSLLPCIHSYALTLVGNLVRAHDNGACFLKKGKEIHLYA